MVAVALFLSGPVAGQSGPWLIRDVRLFDGDTVVERSSVVVDAGKITYIGRNPPLTAQMQIVEGSGKTLLPGFMDAYVYTDVQGLRKSLVFGVTTALDLFFFVPEQIAKIRELSSSKEPMLADFRTSSIEATAPRGHGTEYGIPIPTIGDPSEADKFIDARIKEGADYIKIIYGPGSAGGIAPREVMSFATLQALIVAAHHRHKLAVVHVEEAQRARDAIAAGADGLAHLFVDEEPLEDFGALVASQKTFVIPMASALESVCGSAFSATLLTDMRINGYLTEADRKSLRSTIRAANASCQPYRKTLKLLRDARARVLAGTDAPNPGTAYGASMHGELMLLVSSGLTPVEALRSATSNIADAFRLTDRGRIRVGLRADLLLLEGNPTVEITDTRNIDGIWSAGVRVDRKRLTEEIQQAEQAGSKAN